MILRAAIRSIHLFILLVAAASAAMAQAGESFPYTGYINGADVYLRSGPGDNYYPVSKLAPGQAVEIYRHDPGGWYAIRPDEDCFSWVSAEFLEPGEGNLAVVTGDHVVARVGSMFSDIRDVIQVRLDRGEVVEVIEAKRFNSGPGAQTWYKIAPPAGEFRWISGKFIDRELPQDKPRVASPDNNLLISRHSRRAAAERRLEEEAEDDEYADDRDDRLADADGPSDLSDDDELEDDYPVRRAGHKTSTGGRSHGVRLARLDRDDLEEDRDPLQVSYDEEDGEASDDEGRWRGPGIPIERPRGKGARNLAEGQAGGDDAESSLKEIAAELDLELSAMVAEEPAEWHFAELKRRAESALARAETALDRGRVRRVLRKIDNFSDLQRRYQTVMNVRSQTDRVNERLAGPDRTARSSIQPYHGAARFDGTGRLTQVLSRDPGAPQFALLNAQGQIAYYVSPSPGVNLRRFLNQQVGVSGALGYLPEQHAQHVTAQRIINVDGRLLR
jgi:hypothetical protein